MTTTPSPRSWFRRLAPLAAAAGLLAGLAPATPAEAEAPSVISDVWFVKKAGTGVKVRTMFGASSLASVPAAAQVVTGQFEDIGDGGGSALLYNPGSGPDGIVTTKGGLRFRSTPISGTYQPLVGDFDGNGIDDVLWYAPGTAQDHVWTFATDGSHTSTPISVSGSYRPVVGRFDDGHTDDILWYGPGTAPDSLWLMTSATTHTTVSIAATNDYRPIVGAFGSGTAKARDRVLWYSEGGADSLWSFDLTGHPTSTPVPDVGPGYTAIIGQFAAVDGQGIYWYKPGSAPERHWAFPADGSVEVFPAVAVTGTYTPVAALLNQDGWTDILWYSGATKASVWYFADTAVSQGTMTNLPADARVAVGEDLPPLG